MNMVQALLNEWDIDAVVLDAVLIGSRCRDLEREDSDVDVVVEFYGEISEDALSNDLKDEWIGIDGHEIDINPITKVTKDKSGSLEEYLPKAEEYLAEKADTIAKEQAEAREKAEQQAKEQAEREAAEKEKARIEEKLKGGLKDNKTWKMITKEGYVTMGVCLLVMGMLLMM